jgi:hypothetical protein
MYGYNLLGVKVKRIEDSKPNRGQNSTDDKKGK